MFDIISYDAPNNDDIHILYLVIPILTPHHLDRKCYMPCILLFWFRITLDIYLVELQLKLLFMARQRVEKMMKIYLEASVFFLSLHCLQQRSFLNWLLWFEVAGSFDFLICNANVFSFYLNFLQINRCLIKQDGQFCNLIIYSSGINLHTELPSKQWKAVAVSVV